MFEIQDNIPIPAPRSNSAEYETRQKIKARLKTINIGQTFLIPVHSENLRSVVLMTAKRLGIIVETRKDGEGLRVWRLAIKPTK
jgi:hypothetical protein